MVGTSYAIGVDLAGGSATTTRLFVNAVSETRSTFNVLADGTSGRSDNVVMVGAHLDSVAEGPGVQDNGSGFEPSTANSGHGLAGMRERAELIGGTLDIQSTPREGSTVLLRVATS